MEQASIRRLEAGDAEAFAALRRQALIDAPLAFGSSPDDERDGSFERIARDWLDSHGIPYKAS